LTVLSARVILGITGPHDDEQQKEATVMTLTPAYGRDYKSAKAVKADFNLDKDFVVVSIIDPACGRYVNKADLLDQGSVRIRYAKLTKVTVVKVTAS
jgi:hypothetical protein